MKHSAWCDEVDPDHKLNLDDALILPFLNRKEGGGRRGEYPLLQLHDPFRNHMTPSATSAFLSAPEKRKKVTFACKGRELEREGL